MLKTGEKRYYGLFGGAWLITAAALISKLLGAFYRIPLTRALGAHGMGLYQSVFPSYALIVTLTGGGLTSAVSKMTAENDNIGDCGIFIFASLVLSVPVTVAALCMSRLIASVSGAPEAASALAVLLLCVPLSSVCAVLRGYFQGCARMAPSAVGQLVEQSVKLAAGLTLSFVLVRYSVAAAVTGCAAGVAVAEAAAMLYYLYVGKKRSGKGSAAVVPTEKTMPDEALSGLEMLSETSAELAPPALSQTVPDLQTPSSLNAVSVTGVSASADAAAENAVRPGRKVGSALTRIRAAVVRLVKASIPITLGLAVLPLCQVADSFAVVNLLVGAGADKEAATALYGVVTGPVNSLINLPAVFTVGLCSMLLPRVSKLIRRGERLGGTVRKATFFSAAAGSAFCAALCLGAPAALKILYGKSLGAPAGFVTALLRVSAVSVPFIAVMQTASAVLQGGGKAYVAAAGLLVAAVVKETLNLILLPRVGIYGFVVSTVVFYSLACLFDCVSLWIFVRCNDRRIAAQ